MSCFQNWDIQCGVDSNIISNEEICGNNSSNNKIWWRPMPSDGTSLAIKQEINIRRLLRSLHALFWRPDEFLTRFWQKICEEDHPQTTHGILIISKQASQSYKGNELNCCWIAVGLNQNLDIVLYWAKRNLRSSSFRFASSFFIGYHILHQFKHLSTLENITTLCFPNICIIFPVKAYFDYITKPFVKINNIFSIGACCCPCSVRKIVATLKFK